MEREELAGWLRLAHAPGVGNATARKLLAAFGLRRKQLIRVVRTVASLDAERAAAVMHEAALPNEVRPETLTPADFARLVRLLTPRPDSSSSL